MNKIRTRFAPSPTGLMHFGNLRVALFNYLFAHQQKGHGVFLLRIEDTDIARSELHYRDALLEDLKWVGIHYDEGPFYQSERKEIYDNYYQILLNQNFLYPCFCSEETLAITRKVQLSMGQPPRYPGTCAHLTEAEVNEKKSQNILFTLRFRVPKNESVIFEDLIKGPQRFESDHIGDFIVRRNDGSASFMFCNAIDDATMEVTHALRGDDHLTNTPRQLLILKALQLPLPQYGHFPTILGPDSKPLSKRNGSRSLEELKKEGFLPLGILNYLARLGHYDPDPKFLSLEGLSEIFDVKRISLAPAHYDEQQLKYWQKEAMHHASFEEYVDSIKPFIDDIVPHEKLRAFVELIQPNLSMPKESKMWAELLFDEQLIYDDKAKEVFLAAGPDFFIKAAAQLKNIMHEGEESENFAELFKSFLKCLQEETALKGKKFFLPLRMSFTGEFDGPELIGILKLIGLEKAHKRLLEAAHHSMPSHSAF